MSQRLTEPPEPEGLPEPTASEIVTIDAGEVWARLYWHAGRFPTRWDRFRHVALPTPRRFDAFGAPGVDGVAYGAVPHGPGPPEDISALATCMAEIAQATGTLDRLDQRTFAVVELPAPIRLLDVSSDWATRAGAGTHLSTGPHRVTSGWARAIATRWPDLHGVASIGATRPAGRVVALWSPRCAVQVATSTLLVVRTLDDPVIREALVWAAHLTGTTLLPPRLTRHGSHQISLSRRTNDAGMS